MGDKSKYGPLTFGFDIGIASVGWAVLTSKRILDLGVRCFDAAEQPKDGAPLNLRRRLMRTARNRLARRTWRLTKLRRLLRDGGLVKSAAPEEFTSAPANLDEAACEDPWILRARGLDTRLPPRDWARVIYHLVKHRGFHVTCKAETLDQNSEGGKLSQGVRRTEAMLIANKKWRAAGEMAARDEAFLDHKRNKARSYDNSFARRLLGAELEMLFQRQRELGSSYAGEVLETQVTKLFWLQKPALTGQAMLAMIGRCTFEPKEYRAPKRSFSAERFIWLQRLNNLRINDGGTSRCLTLAERAVAIDLPYQAGTGKVTYRQLRKAIGLSVDPAIGFAGLPYGSKRNKKGELVNPEEATLIELRGWATLRKALVEAGFTNTWQRLSGAALQGQPDLLDGLALTLSIYKSDDELRPELSSQGFAAEEIEALLGLDYSGFVSLSLKAIRVLLPALSAGKGFDEACRTAGYDHANPRLDSGRSRVLPRISPNDLRNPVVYRALNQARKVLNALVREYGPPSAVHVELARDLSKPYDERREILDGQEEFRREKQKAYDYFVEQLGRAPRKDELMKMRLYREQDGQCAYSQRPLAQSGDLRLMFEQTEIDHILPFSRSFDDSQNNKILVLVRENREKANRTPFEYLDGANSSERWQRFEAWVRGHRNLRKAKRDRLLRKHFTGEDAA